MSEANDILKQWGTVKSQILPEPGGVYEKQIRVFAMQIVSKFKQNLQDAGRVASQSLSQSIDFNPITINDDGSVEIEFIGNDYAKFINEGVNGTERKVGAPFWGKSKTVSPITFHESILQWIQFRQIKSLTYLNKKTQKQITKHLVTTEDFEGAAFGIMGAIKRQGIEPSGFIDKAMNQDVINEYEKALQKLWLSL